MIELFHLFDVTPTRLCVDVVSLNQVLRSLSDGVESLALKSGPDIKGVSALVVYVSHYAASMAKKVLGEGV